VESLFEPSEVDAIKQRIFRLTSQSQRQWGKMTAAQALAHCSSGLQMALGEIRPPRAFIGRMLGPMIKPLVLKDATPMHRNSNTIQELIMADDCDLDAERRRLCGVIDRFATVGPVGCTTHPHAFLGSLTPLEWSKLMHKHLDHHLRQFDV
jgi:hypothetical protein